MSQFDSWVAKAMEVKFLAQGNNSSGKPNLASNLESQADAIAAIFIA